MASQLAEIFSAEIDFHRELRKGDTFNLVYEALTADGEPVAWNEGAGRVLAAEFVNAGRTHQALWFVGSDGRGGYYGADGQSRRRIPGQPDGVLAGHLGFRDAHPPHPAAGASNTMAWTTVPR